MCFLGPRALRGSRCPEDNDSIHWRFGGVRRRTSVESREASREGEAVGTSSSAHTRQHTPQGRQRLASLRQGAVEAARCLARVSSIRTCCRRGWYSFEGGKGRRANRARDFAPRDDRSEPRELDLAAVSDLANFSTLPPIMDSTLHYKLHASSPKTPSSFLRTRLAFAARIVLLLSRCACSSPRLHFPSAALLVNDIPHQVVSLFFALLHERATLRLVLLDRPTPLRCLLLLLLLHDAAPLLLGAHSRRRTARGLCATATHAARQGLGWLEQPPTTGRLPFGRKDPHPRRRRRRFARASEPKRPDMCRSLWIRAG